MIYGNNNDIKVLVLIDFCCSVDYLGKVIAEQLEVKFVFYQLKGLKAVNIHKTGLPPAPVDSILSECFEHGNTLYFDLITQEYWIKTKFVITTSLNTKSVLVASFKTPLSIPVKKLRLILIQFAIKFFYENINQGGFHYALNKARFKLMKGARVDLFLDKYLEDNIFNKSRSRNSTGNSLLTVSEVFSFESEIIAHIHLSAIEQIVYETLISKSSRNSIIKEVLKDDFQDFVKNPSNLKITRLLMNYTEKLLINLKKSNDFYVYSPNKSDEVAEDDFEEDNTNLEDNSLLLFLANDFITPENNLKIRKKYSLSSISSDRNIEFEYEDATSEIGINYRGSINEHTGNMEEETPNSQSLDDDFLADYEKKKKNFFKSGEARQTEEIMQKVKIKLGRMCLPDALNFYLNTKVPKDIFSHISQLHTRDVELTTDKSNLTPGLFNNPTIKLETIREFNLKLIYVSAASLLCFIISVILTLTLVK